MFVQTPTSSAKKFNNPTSLHKQQQTKPNHKNERNKTPRAGHTTKCLSPNSTSHVSPTQLHNIKRDTSFFSPTKPIAYLGQCFFFWAKFRQIGEK